MLKKSINAALWFRKKCPVPVLNRLPLRLVCGCYALWFCVRLFRAGDDSSGLLK